MVRRKKRDFYLSLPGNIGTKFRNSQRYTKKKKKEKISLLLQETKRDKRRTFHWKFSIAKRFPKKRTFLCCVVLLPERRYIFRNRTLTAAIYFIQMQYDICRDTFVAWPFYLNDSIFFEIVRSQLRYILHTHNTIFTDTTNFYRYDTV